MIPTLWVGMDRRGRRSPQEEREKLVQIPFYDVWFQSFGWARAAVGGGPYIPMIDIPSIQRLPPSIFHLSSCGDRRPRRSIPTYHQKGICNDSVRRGGIHAARVGCSAAYHFIVCPGKAGANHLLKGETFRPTVYVSTSKLSKTQKGSGESPPRCLI